ncbi:MAG: NAD-dependent epimerase/dehydratase family protein [Thermoplasmata archaeon]|nr:NAD-dependent epimerase/dehydratase family protein [Thermoplasmata archaeon]
MSNGSEQAPVVVTGGAGAIGAIVARRLAEAGHPVRVIDNLSSGHRERLKDLEETGRLRFHEHDLRNVTGMAEILRGAASVWHFAANPNIPKGLEDPRLDLEHGTLATAHVLEAARQAHVPRILFSSSSVVYGMPTVFPTPESYGPLLPESQYGGSKLASEAMISAYCHSYGMKGWIFRFANIVGPGMSHGVIYDFLRKLQRDPTRLEVLGDGRQAKSYLWVDDCVDAMLLAEERSTDPVNVFNLGTEQQVPVRDIAERVVRAFGGTARIEYTGGARGWVGDIPQQLLSVEKIRALGWRPRFDSSTTVDKAIASGRSELGL